MLNGAYTATSGMLSSLQKINVITNNIANVSTVGFKKEGVDFESWSSVSGYNNVLLPLMPSTKEAKGFINETINSMVHLYKDYTNFKGGPIKYDGNNLDFAINGKGFFAVLTPNGVQYTRNGGFSINSKGILVQSGTGYPVLGENYFKNKKLINISGSKFRIRQDGVVLVNGAQIDTLAIRDFSNYANLIREPNNAFLPMKGTKALSVAPIKLEKGYLEMSNVNIIKEMVNLIQAERSFERNQRVVSALGNQLMNNIIQNVGKAG